MNSVVLIVLDGFGIAPVGPGNPIQLANPTNINSYLHNYPNTQLAASGESVGLPASEVGNTEVGHINMGAGRIVQQDLPRINSAIEDGSFYKTEAFLKASEHVKKTGGSLHLIGLVSKGTVHSSINHLYELLSFAKQQNISNVFVHAITDGRDSPPKSSLEAIALLENKIKEIGVGKIASVHGRYYAMDRDHRWDRVEKAYNCLTKGAGFKAETAEEAIKKSYERDVSDEFIEPINIGAHGQEAALIKEGDAVIYFNYRIDRTRELTKAFILDELKDFERGTKIKNLFFVTMTEYEVNLPVEIAFAPEVVSEPLGKVLSDHGLKQLRMAESEKERFVGFYFNGHREEYFPYEERVIIPSQKVATYDQRPEMSANELTETLIIKMKEKKYPFILINFANADMVGHTGSIEATKKAVMVLDESLKKIVQTAQSSGQYVLITADHGNAEQKINPTTGLISTEHTASPVPFIAIHKSFAGKSIKLPEGILADIAPTVLALMNIPKPSEMTGRNLLEGMN